MPGAACYSLVYSGFRCQIEDDLWQKLHSGVLMTGHVLLRRLATVPANSDRQNIQMRPE